MERFTPFCVIRAKFSVVKFHYCPGVWYVGKADDESFMRERRPREIYRVFDVACKLLLEVQCCIQVPCARLLFRLNEEKWICLSFRAGRLVEINVVSRRTDGEMVKMNLIYRRSMLFTGSNNLPSECLSVCIHYNYNANLRAISSF